MGDEIYIRILIFDGLNEAAYANLIGEIVRNLTDNDDVSLF